MEATIEARIANLESIALRLESLLEALIEKEAVQDYYSVSDVAKIAGKSAYQVREWLKTGRMKGEKRASGRGRTKEWMVSHDELTRYKSYGLRPL